MTTALILTLIALPPFIICYVRDCRSKKRLRQKMLRRSADFEIK